MSAASATLAWPLMTDQPAAYVHDTGGLGAPFVASLNPAREPDAVLELVEQSTRLMATPAHASRTNHPTQAPGGRK